MARIVIVGGGISGLALAYRLQEQLPEAQINLLEREARLGGTVRTETRDGFRVEWGPNGFLDNKPTTLKLCRDLGLDHELVQASESSRRHRFLYLDGRLRALPGGPLAFLSTNLLSWRGKLRFLAERWQAPRRDAEDESIDAFARRRAGAEAADLFADALVTGIHAGDPKLLSVRATFPRLVALEQQYGSIMKGMSGSARERRAEAAARGELYQRGSRMWSLRAGLGELITNLSSRLRHSPTTGAVVRALRRTTTGWEVQGEGTSRWPADAVVLACPAWAQAEILAELDAQLAERVGGIAYNRVVVVGLGYRRADVPHPLDGFGFIAPQRDRRDLLGVQWCSSIFPDRAPEGTVLMRALCGGWHRPEIVDWPEGRLLEALRAELCLALGITAPPVFQQVVRWDKAIPQYHLGHLDRVAWIEERVRQQPGLFLAGNAYHGVALNDCTEQAVRISASVRDFVAAGGQ